MVGVIYNAVVGVVSRVPVAYIRTALPALRMLVFTRQRLREAVRARLRVAEEVAREDAYNARTARAPLPAPVREVIPEEDALLV